MSAEFIAGLPVAGLNDWVPSTGFYNFNGAGALLRILLIDNWEAPVLYSVTKSNGSVVTITWTPPPPQPDGLVTYNFLLFKNHVLAGGGNLNSPDVNGRYTSTVNDLSYNSINYEFIIVSTSVFYTFEGNTATMVTRYTSKELIIYVGPPRYISYLSAAPGNGIINVTWQAPSNNGGSPITNYILEYNTTGNSPWYSLAYVPASSPLSYTFGATNGTTYYIRAASTNENGTSQYSSTSARPVGPPTAIPSISDSPGNRQVTLTWGAPSNDGGSTMTYILEYNIGDSGPWSYATTLPASTLSHTYTGLTNGTTYYLRVTATNSSGSVSASIASIPSTIPDQPASLSSTIGGDAKLRLQWSAPYNGGAVISSYTLQYSTESSTGPWTSATLPASPLEYVMTGLINGTTYYLQVAATNVRGTGLYTSTTGIPVGPPTGITNLNATVGDSQVKLDWGVPLNNGGVAITGYTLQYRTSSSGQWTILPLYTTLATLEYIIPGLTNGTTYDFQVAATNVKGTGPYTLKNETPVGPPSIITNLTATPGDSQVTLKWGVPLNNGGSVITGYTLQYSTASSSQQWTPLITLQASALATLEYTIPGLTNGIRYYLQVAATNRYGTRAASTVVSAMPLTNPSIPQNFTGIGINGGVYLSWTAPSIIGALSITAYNIQYSTAPSVSWSQSYSYASSILTLPFTGLTNGTLYYFRLSAENNEGLSSDYAVISAIPQIACQGTTIYKPNNVRFAKQGGVSSSTRTLSLRVNTVNLNGNSFYSAFGAEGANAGKYSTEYNPGYFLKNKYQPPNCKMCCTLTPSPAPTI